MVHDLLDYLNCHSESTLTVSPEHEVSEIQDYIYGDRMDSIAVSPQAMMIENAEHVSSLHEEEAVMFPN